jgi:hypothetical protein
MNVMIDARVQVSTRRRTKHEASPRNRDAATAPCTLGGVLLKVRRCKNEGWYIYIYVGAPSRTEQCPQEAQEPDIKMYIHAVL